MSTIKIRSHGNNVHDIIIVHVISADAQINRCGKCKVTLGPAGRVWSVWLVSKNVLKMETKTGGTYQHVEE